MKCFLSLRGEAGRPGRRSPGHLTFRLTLVIVLINWRHLKTGQEWQDMLILRDNAICPEEDSRSIYPTVNNIVAL
jgi:hypothetical protein